MRLEIRAPGRRQDQAGMTEEDLNQIRTILREALEATMESIAEEFSELRGEMNRRFDLIDQRFAGMEKQLDRILSGR
jgi:hypothetical protein